MGLMKPDVSDADKGKAGEADKKTGDKPIDIFAAALSRKGKIRGMCLIVIFVECLRCINAVASSSLLCWI